MSKEAILSVILSALIIPFLIYCGKALYKRLFNYYHKKKIYNWLKSNTEDKASKRFKSTSDIATGTGLLPDRIEHICTVHPEIKKSSKNKFGIYEEKSRYEEEGAEISTV